MARSIRVSQELSRQNRRALQASRSEYLDAATDPDGSRNVYEAVGLGYQNLEKRSAQECDLVWLVRPLLRTRRVDLRSDERESLCVCRPGRGLMKTETTDMNPYCTGRSRDRCYDNECDDRRRRAA